MKKLVIIMTAVNMLAVGAGVTYYIVTTHPTEEEKLLQAFEGGSDTSKLIEIEDSVSRSVAGGGYKPITLTREDIQNTMANPFGDANTLNLMEQVTALNQLETYGDEYIFACAADYEDKKQYVTAKSEWGVYYKKLGKAEYDVIIDLPKFIEFARKSGG